MNLGTLQNYITVKDIQQLPQWVEGYISRAYNQSTAKTLNFKQNYICLDVHYLLFSVMLTESNIVQECTCVEHASQT